jgi:glycine hydroxymethyltransferase
MGLDETRELTGWIADILDDINNEETIERVRGQVLDLCKRFPVYA